MISISDDLLARIDARARATDRSRSGLIQDLAERELEEAGRDRQALIEGLLSEALPMGGDAADVIRRDRRRDDR